MDLYRIIGELVEERGRLQRIIESIEAMASTDGKPTHAQTRLTKRRGRKSMDPAARREASTRMKLYWEKRRAAQTPEVTAH